MNTSAVCTSLPMQASQLCLSMGSLRGTLRRTGLRARRYELTHGYEPRREAAMAAFARSWRRE
jgi:hypothetical protein